MNTEQNTEQNTGRFSSDTPNFQDLNPNQKVDDLLQRLKALGEMTRIKVSPEVLAAIKIAQPANLIMTAASSHAEALKAMRAASTTKDFEEKLNASKAGMLHSLTFTAIMDEIATRLGVEGIDDGNGEIEDAAGDGPCDCPICTAEREERANTAKN